MEKRFKLACVMMGSGWPSGHVAIDWYHSWPDNPGGKEILLNGDTQNETELLAEIDDLIAELQELKAQVPARYAHWRRPQK